MSEQTKPELDDSKYNKDEFNKWFYKLCLVDFPAFYRDILRAEKKTLWDRFKIVADEYHNNAIENKGELKWLYTSERE